MTTDTLLQAFATVAPEHEGPLAADEFLGRPCIRCYGCQRIVWRPAE